MGRPSDFTAEIAATICGRLSDGESLRSICRSEDMPASSTVFLWLGQDKAFSEQYARAREAQADALFEETLEIADDASGDFELHEGEARLRSEHVQRSRLRVDTRKWMASKLAPKKYGDRSSVEVGGIDGAPIEFSETQAAAKIAAIMEAARARRVAEGAE